MSANPSARRRTVSLGVLALVTVASLAVQVPTAAGASSPPARTLTATKADLGTLGTRYSDAVAVEGRWVVCAATGSTGSSFVYDRSTRTRRALGTLGGKFGTTPVDIDHGIVVGTGHTASENKHAFAYDVATGAIRDLGTLGGATSSAIAVSDGVVVGTSLTAAGFEHAFAYDLSAGAMRDLGTLGGAVSKAVDVDAGIVVGWSSTADPTAGNHTFAYDLRAAVPVMRDLGDGFPTAVDEGVVVGQYQTAAGPSHAWAYDLAAASPARKDLGALGGASSGADDVDAGVVVGFAQTAGHATRAFAYDLRAANPRMQDLGAPIGGTSRANSISGRYIVGVAYRAGDHQPRAFAYDLAGTRRMADLGQVGSNDNPGIVVDGSVAVGTSYLTVSGTGDDQQRDGRAAAWTMRTTTAPAFTFGTTQYSTSERATRVKVTVVRAGNRNRAVSVHYATRGLTAAAGKDFRSTSGALRFARGQVRKAFYVKVLNDRRKERAETIQLTLRSPSAGAILGAPNAAALTIRAND